MRLTTPNQLTILRMILTPIFIVLFLEGGPTNILIASIIYLLASITDWYDGYMARRLQLVTRWGQFMDPLADKLLVSSALIVFACEHYVEWWMVIIIILRDFIVTGLRSFALYIGKPIITSVLAKWKTFAQMASVFIILIYISIPGLPEIRLDRVQHPYLLWTTWIMLLVVLLTVISGTQYLIVNYSHVSELFRRTLYWISHIFTKDKE